MTTYMESQAQQHRDKAVDKLTNKLKNRIIDTQATNAYLKHKNLYKSWVRHLWAQRTGALNYQGAMEATNKHTTCPICHQNINQNQSEMGITWHALLECEHPQIQQLYKEWADNSNKHWTQLTNQLNSEEQTRLIHNTIHN